MKRRKSRPRGVFSRFFEALRRRLGLASGKRPSRHRTKKKKATKVRSPRRAKKRRPAHRVRQQRPSRPGRRSKASQLAQKKKAAILVGVITHYYPRVKAAVIKLKRPLIVGEPVWIKGRETDFRQTVASLQIDRVAVPKARAGQEVGLEVMRDVREGDEVFVSI